MRIGPFAALLLLVSSPALAGKLIQYGNRAGQTAHVISTSGLSTAQAVLQAKITRSDAVAFCREYVLRVTHQCIANTLSIPLKHPASANCPARTFTDFNGDHWHFAGPRSNNEGMTKYRLVHMETGEEADGSMASNYDISLSLFRALCPKQAPMDSDGY